MMKTKLLLLLVAALMLAGIALSQPILSGLLNAKPVVAGGGEPTGAPVFLNCGTNSGTSGTLLYVTNSTSGNSPRLHLLHLTWYPVDVSTISEVTNSLGVSGTFLTNAFWDTDRMKSVVYYWTNSAMTYAAVRVANAPSEWIAFLAQVTNAATTSIFSGIKTNRSSGNVAVSNVVSSATTSLVVSFGGHGNGSGSPTPTITGGTTFAFKTMADLHGAAAMWSTGATLVTNSMSWGEGGVYSDLISFSIGGYP
jgi:hypothetical protein